MSRLKHSGVAVECYACGAETEVPIEQLRDEGFHHAEDVDPRDCLSAMAREQRLLRAIAKARKLMRQDRRSDRAGFGDAAYRTLDWRQR